MGWGKKKKELDWSGGRLLHRIYSSTHSTFIFLAQTSFPICPEPLLRVHHFLLARVNL